MFDRAVVISLARRADRLHDFYGRLPADWPWPCPEPFEAVDGLLETPPIWWKTTAGAWGCYRSHAEVIGQALADGVERLLVLEDDATFVPTASERVAALDVPDDCQQLYLGGQHLSKPEPGPPGLVRGRNVNRTHAYAVLGREALEILSDHLRPDPVLWKSRHHVDHHYGLLHQRRAIAVYAVRPWICGQAAGESDVGKPMAKPQFWESAR